MRSSSGYVTAPAGRVTTSMGALVLAAVMAWGPACSRNDSEASKVQAAASSSASDTQVAPRVVVPPQEPFVPPLDGLLTPMQVEMFLAVRNEASTMTWAIEGPDKFLPLDIRAAKKLGVRTDEYTWVKAVIAQTLDANFKKKMSGVQQHILEQQLKKAQAEQAGKGDARAKAALDEQIQAFKEAQDQLRGQDNEEDPAVLANRKLILDYGVGGFSAPKGAAAGASTDSSDAGAAPLLAPQ